MTRTTPLRRTTRHASHTRFTDALTFIFAFGFFREDKKSPGVPAIFVLAPRALFGCFHRSVTGIGLGREAVLLTVPPRLASRECSEFALFPGHRASQVALVRKHPSFGNQ
jgi:hypothetical protein